jgi:hypothetical protein
MVKGKMSKFYVLTVYSNSEMRPHLKACVSSSFNGIPTTSDPSLRLSLLRDKQEVSLGEFVDGP